MSIEESIALLKLTAAGGAVTPRRALLEMHGTASAVLAARASAWRAGGLNDQQTQRLQNPDEADLQRTLAWLELPGRHLIGWQDEDYPPMLRRISGAPLALFIEGDPNLLWRPAVAVVGSRSPTAGGRDNAYAFSRAFAAAGIVVVSGMAAGIDAAAHEAALAAPDGSTVAILGTGPDLAYPPSNAGLRDRIAAHGALVSEHPPGTGAKQSHFPSRNRIIAGLALGTVVIEAAERSGALITARLAGENGREVFAVPGSIHNPLARGCHRLIREGAGLVESAQEVIAALAPLASELASALRTRLDEAERGPLASTPQALDNLQPNYQKLWDALGFDPTGMDQLVSRTGLTAAELSSMLLIMELDGRVAVEHGRYQRKTGFFTSTASSTQAEGQ